MKTIDIITRDMHQLHGANKVTEKLILGKDYFAANGLKLRYIISQDGVIDCNNYKSNLGKQLNTVHYKRKRRIIELLKKLPVYKTYFIQRIIVKREFEKNKKICQYVDTIDEKPDFIIYQDPFAAIYYLKKTGDLTKSLFISHADTDPLEQLFLGRASLLGTQTETYIREELKKFFDHVGAVVTICTASKNYMKGVYGKICPCIINGIEDMTIIAKRKYSDNDSKIHIAIVASIQYRKGQDIAVEALSKLPDDKKKKLIIHIIGGGEGSGRLTEQVKNLDLIDNVILHGPILDVENYLPMMDAFLLPSRADTVPIAIIEAMRAGLPIFATDVGEIPEMISGCGEVIEATVESVQDLYSRIVEERFDLVKLGENSREKYLTEFQLKSMINKYSNVVNEILSEI